MDPLSALSGILGIADIATRASSKIWHLIEEWQDAPAQLQLLQQEIRESRDLLEYLRTACDALRTHASNSSTSIITQLVASQLEHVRLAWTDLDRILDSVSETTSTSGIRIRKDRWIRQRAKAARL